MSKVIIMRGPSGCGKGTWIQKHVPEAFVVSADNFFMKPCSYPTSNPTFNFHGKMYEYVFDPSKLGEAHAQCMFRFINLIRNPCSNPLIVVDNTNIHHWEFEAYISSAKLADYDVQVVAFRPYTIDEIKLCAMRNTHRVPIGVIAKMCYEFEPHRLDREVPIEA